MDADVIAGKLNRKAASAFGLREGMPVMAGLMDGSAGMLRAGTRHGQLFNVVGSTAVLALCTEKTRPQPHLPTRALGLGRKWLAVSTIASTASSIVWVRDQFFPKIPVPEFHKLIHRLSRRGPAAAGGVAFAPYMAGERTRIEHRHSAFTGITLATTRENLLSAIIEGLIQASAERLPLLEKTGPPHSGRAGFPATQIASIKFFTATGSASGSFIPSPMPPCAVWPRTSREKLELPPRFPHSPTMVLTLRRFPLLFLNNYYLRKKAFPSRLEDSVKSSHLSTAQPGTVLMAVDNSLPRP